METKIVDNIIFYPIADFPKYFISECVKIYSEKSNKILKPSSDDGYFRVQLCKDGKKYKKLVHRLLAEIFIPNPENKPCIDHITRKENNQNQSKKDTSLWQGVSYYPRNNRYRAQWRDENGKQCEVSYSYSVYGIFALLMAINKREEMVKILYNRPE